MLVLIHKILKNNVVKLKNFTFIKNIISHLKNIQLDTLI